MWGDSGKNAADNTNNGRERDDLQKTMGGSPGELSEELVTQEKRKKGWIINCDVGEATEGLENELSGELS